MIIDFTKITSPEFDGIDKGDYPDFCDTFLVSAEYDGEVMSEEMVEYINDNHWDWVYETMFETVLH